MRKRTRGLPACFAAALVLSCACTGLRIAAATGEAASTPASDPRRDMVAALKATGPHPSLGDHARVLGRLVGTWNVEYTDFSKDGKTTHRSGELLIGWVMDGRALEDVWIVNPSAARKEREIYAEVRYFDAKSGTWRAVFVDPQDAAIATFKGGAVGDDQIVFESQDLVPNESRRWSFNDIRPDSLVYREEASSDGGKTWRLESQYRMKRRGTAPTVR
jgi:hypothetical protein